MSKNTHQNLSHTPKYIICSILGTGFFVVLCGIISFPVIAGLLASFRPGTELIRKGLALDLDPTTMTLANYKYLFGGNQDSRKYFMWYKNSLLITVLSVVLTLLICYFVAYGLTMYNFKLQNLLFTLVIATMMVPFEILMLPMYKEIIALGLIDTYVGVIITGLCSASTIFFFRQYMTGLPKELLSAARIDGANEYYISVKIIMPLVKPAFASMGILCAMGSWNAILWPLLVLKGAEKFTLPIGLNTLLTPYGNNYDVLIAGSMFGILPIFIIFLVFQKYIIDGMTAGAVKG